MSAEKVDTLVVGAGQAGLAMSEHLGKLGVDHLVLERHRIAECWRSERWDSLVSNGPAWHDRFPGMEFPHAHPDAFASKAALAEYFVAYAEMIAAPVRVGVNVESATRVAGTDRFLVETSRGAIEARNIVAATGPFQRGVVPPVVPAAEGLYQIHSSAYKNPDQLPAGGVLVVGAGSSGAQIADELLDSGRRVHLSVGPHNRLPRSYRGRDLAWWLGVLGKWDEQTPGPRTEHVTIAVSGVNGGRTIDYRNLANRGMTLVGRTLSSDNGVLRFADDLVANIARGDAVYASTLDEADAYLVRNGLHLPEDPDARRIEPDPACLTIPIRQLDLAKSGITTIIWATGFVSDYGWLKAGVLDAAGRPRHTRGISPEPGIYFLGLPWQSGRASSFIWGVWHDARFVADHIAIRSRYVDYDKAARDGHTGLTPGLGPEPKVLDPACLDLIQRS